MQLSLMSRRFAAACAISCALIISTSQGFDVTVRWNDLHQRITGFGASTAWTSSNVMRMTDPARGKLLDSLFDTTIGAGCSMIRALVPYNLENASGVWTWTGDAAQVWMMQEAQKRGVRYFWGAPWSPPPWMKSNNSSVGGSLLSANYQNFADYLSRYVREYKNQFGIDMSGISVQNEPHFSPSWDGCQYSGAQIRDFIKNNLGPTFVRDGVQAKIIMPESNWDQREWADPTLADTAALKYAGVVALHFYQDDKTATPYPAVKLRNKELWESECSWAGDGGVTMNGAALWFKARHDLLTRAEVNAWHFWWFFDNKPDGEGLVNTNGSGGYITTKRLWTLGNYSRFARSGWYMMGLPRYYSSDSLVSISAFRDSASGKFAIVVGNFDEKLLSYTLNINFDGFLATTVTPWLTDETHNLVRQPDIAVANGAFSATVAGYSVVTFAGTATPLAPASVRVDSFCAAAEYSIPGQTDTLIWSTGNGASVSIDNGVGAVAAAGRAVVSPSSTTTYVLTAQGPGGPIMRRVTVTVLPAREPDNPSPVSSGLDYAYYEHYGDRVPDFTTLTPKKTGTMPVFGFSARDRDVDYSFKIFGYLDAPADGVYSFQSKSCGSIKLWIGTSLLNSTNAYGVGVCPLQVRCGLPIGLKAGKHYIMVGTHIAYGCNSQTLNVFWKGPGVPYAEIPVSRLYRTGVPLNTRPGLRAIAPPCEKRAVILYDVHGRRTGQSLESMRALSGSRTGAGVFVVAPEGADRNGSARLIVQ